MIAKHVPIRSLKKSDFAGLVKYIVDEQGKAERLGQVKATNCQSENIQAVIAEVLATQQANKRAKSDKTYHLIISFPAGEKPELETLNALEDRICSGLGFEDHQRISAVHYDTDNVHVHVAINKIHPTRGTMHDPYQAYRSLGHMCDAFEDEYGLTKDNHQAHRTISQGRASDMERHAGIESLVTWIQSECLDELQSARTWKELNEAMNKNGLELRQRANGFVIESEDGTKVKASTVARDLSKPKLEARLGPFEEVKETLKAQRRYSKRPVSFKINTTELYARYQQEQKELLVLRKGKWDNAKESKNRRIEAAKRSNRLRRSAIKLMGGSRVSKKLLYAQAHNSFRSEVQTINKNYKQERQRLYEQFKRQAWADWLKQQAILGDQQALKALRARDQSKGLNGNTISGVRTQADDRQASSSNDFNKPNVEGIGREPPPFAKNRLRALSSLGMIRFNREKYVTDGITKKGTIIFRTNKSTIRDDGDKLQISRDATSTTIKEALRMAMERYGNTISVAGTPQFKAQVIRAAIHSDLPITFSDAHLERRRQLLKEENSYDRRNEQEGRRDERGRANRRSNAGARRTITLDDGRGEAGREHRSDARDGGSHELNKPNVAGIGGEPPPFAKNRLRALSSLGVVRFARRSEMLLPSDVSRELEHEGAESNNQLRWGVSRSRGIEVDQFKAADKYIAEREEKRLKGFDIPKHSRYTNQTSQLSYGGIRNVDGQSLGLLRHENEILVLPIDEPTAQRMKRVRVGEVVTVTSKGSLKRVKGRSR